MRDREQGLGLRLSWVLGSSSIPTVRYGSLAPQFLCLKMETIKVLASWEATEFNK